MTAQDTVYFALISTTFAGMLLEPSDDVGIQLQRDLLLYRSVKYASTRHRPLDRFGWVGGIYRVVGRFLESCDLFPLFVSKFANRVFFIIPSFARCRLASADDTACLRTSFPIRPSMDYYKDHRFDLADGSATVTASGSSNTIWAVSKPSR